MSRPLITIVTPVLNGEAYLRDTVESVLSQTGDFDLQYIVRDGGSTDGTLAILAEYADRIELVSQRDGSPQEAINAGMADARGTICAWLNADDIYLPGTLQTVVQAFSRHPDRQWAYGRCSIIDAAGTEIRKPITLSKNIIGFFYSRHTLLCENFVNQPATFWTRSLWETCGGLDITMKAAFDYALWLQMSRHSAAIPIHQHFSAFRRHETSISENFFDRQFAEQYTAAAAYGNALHRLIHRLSNWKTIVIYNLLSRRK